LLAQFQQPLAIFLPLGLDLLRIGAVLIFNAGRPRIAAVAETGGLPALFLYGHVLKSVLILQGRGNVAEQNKYATKYFHNF